MKTHKVQVEFGVEEMGNIIAAVFLDGVELTGVRTVRIESDHSGLTEVTLTLVAIVSAEIKTLVLPVGKAEIVARGGGT